MCEMAGCLHPDGFLFSGLFWDFGSLCQRRCGVISYALSRQPYFRLCHSGDFHFVSRHKPTEHHTPDVSAAPTLRRHVSRPVAAGVSLSLKDVAASQCVCSCGAATLSSHDSSFRSDSSSTSSRGTYDSAQSKVKFGEFSEARRVAQFSWRLYSIAQRADPKILRDRVDRGTLAPQMEPEDVCAQVLSERAAGGEGGDPSTVSGPRSRSRGARWLTEHAAHPGVATQEPTRSPRGRQCEYPSQGDHPQNWRATSQGPAGALYVFNTDDVLALLWSFACVYPIGDLLVCVFVGTYVFPHSLVWWASLLFFLLSPCLGWSRCNDNFFYFTPSVILGERIAFRRSDAETQVAFPSRSFDWRLHSER